MCANDFCVRHDTLIFFEDDRIQHIGLFVHPESKWQVVVQYHVRVEKDVDFIGIVSHEPTGMVELNLRLSGALVSVLGSRPSQEWRE